MFRAHALQSIDYSMHGLHVLYLVTLITKLLNYCQTSCPVDLIYFNYVHKNICNYLELLLFTTTKLIVIKRLLTYHVANRVYAYID